MFEDGVLSFRCKEALQYHGFVVLLIFGTVDQRDSSFGHLLPQERELFFIAPELRFVARLKLRPPGWIVSKPFPKLCAWRYVL